MENVIAEINIKTPTGRRLVRELEHHRKTVKITYPLPDIIGQKTYSVDEVFDELESKLEEHYGTW